MKKIFVMFGLMIFCLSFVFAGQGVQDGTGVYHEGVIALGGQDGNELDLQGQAFGQQVRSGEYFGENGNRFQIQIGEQERQRIISNGIEARFDCNLTQEQMGEQTILRTQLSNGRNAEIKIMPDTASENALQRLRLKNCDPETCSLELKEVGQVDKIRLAYELHTKKSSKVFGLFKAQMQVRAQIDAENGEIINVSKPWWAFLTSEPEETF